jgi:hypothetical protein
MAGTRKLAAIWCSDVVGYSRLAGEDEDRILARLRALRSDLIDPTVVVHNGRVVKRTGDGSNVEFRSVVDAVRCAIEIQNAMVERNAGAPITIIAPVQGGCYELFAHAGIRSIADLKGKSVGAGATEPLSRVRLLGWARPEKGPHGRLRSRRETFGVVRRRQARRLPGISA